jgi:hypothetical protein
MGISWSWITENLATGGKIDSRADVTELVEAGVTHVLNLRELDEEQWLGGARVTAHAEAFLLRQTFEPAVHGQASPGYCHNPTPDDGKPKDVEWFRRSLNFVLPALAAGGRCYCHCSAGYNRGPSTAFCVLRATGWPHSKAFWRVKWRRKIALFGGMRYWPDAERALADLTPYLSGLGYQFPPWP